MLCSSQAGRSSTVEITCIALFLVALVSPPGIADPSRPGHSGPDAADVRYFPVPAQRPALVVRTDSHGFSRSVRARELQMEVSAWLHQELGLPAVPSAPELQFVPDDRIAEQRIRDVPADWIGAPDADVLAVYDDDTRTIYLPESWSADQSVGGSILVHEMVHHIQNLSGETFACLEAREAAAFDAQERWLNRFGNSLEIEFGIDPFTVLARTMCAW